MGPQDTTWGSNWAGGEASALLADYDWMYDDGPHSPNMDCRSATASSGCWDHRRNVLSNYGPHPAIGAAASTVDGVTSMTELLTSGPAGLLDYAIRRSPSSSRLHRWSSDDPPPAQRRGPHRLGRRRLVPGRATVFGDEGRWSVTPVCVASAGTSCHLVVNFVPLRSGAASGTVTVSLPGGSEQVQVDAFAGQGYWEANTQGGVYAFAGGGFRGSASDIKLAKPVTGMVATPDGGGYWEVAADGGVFSFGDARFYGSAADMHVGQPFVGMAATPDGGGYWLVARTGGVYAFGDASYYGAPDVEVTDIVGMAATKDGRGYWLVARDGSIYAFGDAQFYGVPPVAKDRVFVGMAASHDGRGYWLVTDNGSVFAFGDAKYYGSNTGPGLTVPWAWPSPLVARATTSSTPTVPSQLWAGHPPGAAPRT